MYVLTRNASKSARKEFSASIWVPKFRSKYTRRYVRLTVIRDKVESLIGFAVKAGKVVYGADTLESYKKRYHIIFLCNTATENTKKKVIAVAEKKHVPVVLSENVLENTVGRKNCKVVAVLDKQMSEAMLARLGENYRLIGSEVR